MSCIHNADRDLTISLSTSGSVLANETCTGCGKEWTYGLDHLLVRETLDEVIYYVPVGRGRKTTAFDITVRRLR
jgi:hypothetical protein